MTSGRHADVNVVTVFWPKGLGMSGFADAAGLANKPRRMSGVLMVAAPEGADAKKARANHGELSKKKNEKCIK